MPDTTETIREFQLARDLGKVAKLIEAAFGEEIGEDRLTSREVLSLRILSPVIWLLGLISPSARDIFSGLVLVRDGRIVGNVTISRLGGDPLRMLIGNVAVSPDCQRQGIARRLMLASFTWIRDRGANLAVLDVRADNTPALTLYEDLGFERLETSIELRYEGRTAPGSAPTDVSAVLSLGLGDLRKLLRLQRETTPVDVQALMPIRENAAMTTLVSASLGPFGRLLSGRETAALATETDGEITGAAEITLQDGLRGNRISFTVRPNYMESALLIDAVLKRIGSTPGHIRAEAKGRDTSLIAALEAGGFVKSRSLIRMTRAV